MMYQPQDAEIETLRRAAKAKDARSAAERVRERHLNALVGATRMAGFHLTQAEDLMRQAEDGFTWRYRRRDQVFDPIHEAREHIDAALKEEGRAAQLSEKIAKLDEIIAQTRRGGDDPWPGPTVQMMMRIATGKVGDGIARLAATGTISEDDLYYAREIARLHDWAVRGLGAKTMRFERGVSGGLPDDHDAYQAHMHAKVYCVWWARYKGDAEANSEIGIAFAVEGLTIDAARRRFAMRRDRLIDHLRKTLRAYAAIRRRAGSE